MRLKFQQCFLIPIGIIILIANGGCSGTPKPVAVTGTVTFNGQSVPEGIVQFEPVTANDGQRRDAMIVDGKFTLPAGEGLQPGLNFKVIIRAFKKTGRKYPNADVGMSWDEKVQYLPPRYNSESDLRVTISSQESENDLTFELVSKKN